MSIGLLGFDSVHQRQGGAWEYISPSRLNCWLSCPLKWRFRYLDNIRTPTTASLFIGKVVHSGLEGYYRHRHLGITLDADDVVQRMWQAWAQLVDEEKMAFDSADAEQSMRRQTADLVKAYLAQAPQDERPQAVEVAAEAPLIDPTTGENFGIPLVEILSIVVYGSFSGGDLGNTDSVNEDRSSEDFHEHVRAVEEPPLLGCRLHELVDHRQAGHARTAPLRSFRP